LHPQLLPTSEVSILNLNLSLRCSVLDPVGYAPFFRNDIFEIRKIIIHTKMKITIKNENSGYSAITCITRKILLEPVLK
jgi:hypothetical protein